MIAATRIIFRNYDLRLAFIFACRGNQSFGNSAPFWCVSFQIFPAHRAIDDFTDATFAEETFALLAAVDGALGHMQADRTIHTLDLVHICFIAIFFGIEGNGV